MRILIVGGGIAGLALARLLRRRGIQPVVVEKTRHYGGVGYVIVLWPAGGRILRDLELYDGVRVLSRPLDTYRVCDAAGREVRSLDLRAFTDEYGEILSVRRADLVDVLRGGCRDVDLRMGTTVESLDQDDDRVSVRFSDDSTGSFDLVVGCDGIHSGIRRLTFPSAPLRYLGWTGWAWWLSSDTAVPGTALEYWGAGRFLGIYPAGEAACCFCALPARANVQLSLPEQLEWLRDAFAPLGGQVPRVIEQLPENEELWHDDFNDIQMETWRKGRVLLIGDASAAILPTAGLGASMAMESAVALADELGRSRADSLDLALRLFERRRRKRVDEVQRESVRLGRAALMKSRLGGWFRNQVVRRLSDERMLGKFKSVLEEPF